MQASVFKYQLSTVTCNTEGCIVLSENKSNITQAFIKKKKKVNDWSAQNILISESRDYYNI